MKILITGSGGYIGSVLAQTLMSQRLQVVGLDTGYYRDGLLFNPRWDFPYTFNMDIRAANRIMLEGFDAVVHLAELSNDPTGALNPKVTQSINYEGSMNLAHAAKKAGVSRFIYSSSCSVYGFSSGIVTEEHPLNPQTEYARCKCAVEEELLKMSTAAFCPVVLRNATVFGLSPYQRFDVVLNNLAGLAWTTKKVSMTCDGSPWRPLVHVRDVCRAITNVLVLPFEKVQGEIFNVGDHSGSRISDIAKEVQKVFGGDIVFGPEKDDNRSYRVSFEKIKETLGFRALWRISDTLKEFQKLFSRTGFGYDQFTHRGFTRLKQLKYLLATNQVNNELIWL